VVISIERIYKVYRVSEIINANSELIFVENNDFASLPSRAFFKYNYWGIYASRPFACPSSEAIFSVELGPIHL
jgi:hypothetical protein